MTFPKMRPKRNTNRSKYGILKVENVEADEQESAEFTSGVTGVIRSSQMSDSGMMVRFSTHDVTSVLDNVIMSSDFNVSHADTAEEKASSVVDSVSVDRSTKDDRRRSSVKHTHITLSNIPEHSSSSHHGVNKKRHSFKHTGNQTQTLFKPTYQMGPLPGREFDYLRSKRMMEELMSTLVTDNTYDIQSQTSLLKVLSSTIIRRLKYMDFPRFRYVCHVSTVQRRGQGVMVASRHLWDRETDRCIHITRECDGFVVVVTLYAIYQE